MCRGEFHPIADPLLQLFDLFIGKLDRPAAPGAYHMVMMLVTDHVFEHMAAIAERHFAYQPALDQQCKCAVHRGFGHARPTFAQQQQQLVGVEMFVGREHGIEHLAPRCRHPQVALRQEPLEPSYVNIAVRLICFADNIHRIRAER